MREVFTRHTMIARRLFAGGEKSFARIIGRYGELFMNDEVEMRNAW